MEEKAIHRLFKYLDFKGVSVSSIEKELAIGNGLLGKQLKVNGTISSDNLEKIYKRFPEMNLEYIIAGEGELEKTLQDIALNAKEFKRIISTYQNAIEMLYDKFKTEK